MEASKEEKKSVSEVEEEKKEAQEEKPKFEASLDVKRAMDELNIDPADPKLSEEYLIERFQEIVDDPQVHFLRRDRFTTLIELLGKHKFWETQAIMLAKKKVQKEGEIKKFTAEEIPKEPTPLPPGFEWDTFDVTDDKQVEEVCEFIMDHYVEDPAGNFRLQYSKEKFKWGVATPGYIKDMHFIVRNSKNKKILATCVGVPKKLVVLGRTIKVCEANFLSVHRALRKKRLAQIMVQEIMRRKRLNGFMQAYYTSGHTIPTPFTTSNYLNRFINPKKLAEIMYCNKPSDLPMKQFEKRYRLPDREGIKLQGALRVMQKKDLSQVHKLYHEQQKKYKVYYKLSQEEISHYLLPKEDVVWTYVIENEVDGRLQVTDFFSMFRLTQTCTSKEKLNHNYDLMHSGCLYYYGLTRNTLKEVVKQAMWSAKEDMDCDAFSAMTVMDNEKEMFLEELKFLHGDGALHWYLVNWSLGEQEVGPNDIGTILI